MRPAAGADPGSPSVAITVVVVPAVASVELTRAPSVGAAWVGGPYVAGFHPGLETFATGTPPACSPADTSRTWARPPLVASSPHTAIATVLDPSACRIPSGR